MNSLEKLAIEQINKIAHEIGTEVIAIGNLVRTGQFDESKHSYPTFNKAQEIQKIVKALIESNKTS